MSYTVINTELAGILISEYKPNVYILTHERITSAYSSDYVITEYCPHEYEYDESIYSLVFKDTVYTKDSVVIPSEFSHRFPNDKRCWCGHLISNAGSCGLKKVVSKTERFLKPKNWTNKISLKGFNWFYYFKYWSSDYLIISDNRPRDLGTPVWCTVSKPKLGILQMHISKRLCMSRMVSTHIPLEETKPATKSCGNVVM